MKNKELHIDQGKLQEIQDKLSEYSESLKDLESFKEAGDFPLKPNDLTEAFGTSDSRPNYFKYELYKSGTLIYSDIELNLDKNQKLIKKLKTLSMNIAQWDNVCNLIVIKNNKIRAYPKNWEKWFDMFVSINENVPMYYEDDLTSEENNPQPVFFLNS